MGNRFGVGHYIKWALSKTMLSVFISEASLFWDVSFKVSVFFFLDQFHFQTAIYRFHDSRFFFQNVLLHVNRSINRPKIEIFSESEPH